MNCNRAFFAIIFAAFCLLSSNAMAEIRLSGLEQNEALKTYLTEKVVDVIQKETPQASALSIRAKLQRGLEAKGYYAAQISVQETEDAKIFTISPAAQYTISSYEVIGYNDQLPAVPFNENAPLIAASVLDTQRDILDHILDNGCFYNLSVTHKVLLDNISRSADITYEVDAQNPAFFGATTFIGADNIKESFLENFLEYEEGACWKANKLEATKTALLRSGLIRSLEVDTPEILPANKQVPIAFKIKESAPRTVRLGANFNTSDGPGISAQWTHNNFYGAGEEVSLGTDVSAIRQGINLGFSKPYFLMNEQSFEFSSSFAREDNDAFEEVALNVSGSIKRELSRYWTASLGAGIETSKISEDNGPTDNFGLLFFPGTIGYDSRDDILNPADGHTLNLLATPFIDVLGTASPFFKTRATGTTYFDFSKAILALRMSLGSIWGAQNDDIPASRRFYSGGGGSIRGFGYQEAGPRDSDNDPAGGRSLLETNLELRTKFTDTIGGVAFIDGGGVYDSPFPDFEGGAYIGAGVGVRYYTDFGPIRFDVGVPLNNTDDLDQTFQIYISIGQAF